MKTGAMMRVFFLPSLPLAQRVAGGGRGWGVTHDVSVRVSNVFAASSGAMNASLAEALHSPHPRPLPATRKCAWVGGEKRPLRLGRHRLPLHAMKPQHLLCGRRLQPLVAD